MANAILDYGGNPFVGATQPKSFSDIGRYEQLRRDEEKRQQAMYSIHMDRMAMTIAPPVLYPFDHRVYGQSNWDTPPAATSPSNRVLLLVDL